MDKAVDRFSEPMISPQYMKKEDTSPGNQYQSGKTPDHLEGGALRPGGAANIYSKENIGLVLQYAALGAINGSIYGIIYPLLNNYLRMSGVATATARVLARLPWSFRMFFGLLSDCFPIMNNRRRPYMVIGWTVTAISLLLMAVLPLDDPYYPEPQFARISPANLTMEQVDSFNTNAPDSGIKYVLLIILADLGMVVAIAASDGLVVELEQRETEANRGRVLSSVQVAKQLMVILASAMVGFGLNGPDYGGSFSGSMGFPAIMGVCAAFAILAAASAWFFVKEGEGQKQKFRDYMHSIYDLLQERVVYQLIGFNFLYYLFNRMSVTAVSPIQSVWAGVEPVNDALSNILSALITSLTLYSVKKWGLSWSWQAVIVTSQVAVVVIDCIPTYLTIWNVLRSQWFWLGPPLLEDVPDSITRLVGQFATLEIIEPGNEGAIFGLMSSCTSISAPFATVIYKNIDANFDIALTDLQRDDTDVRNQVTYVYIIAHAFQLASIIWVLMLLPRQKNETQELKRSGGKSNVMGIATIIIFAFCLIWAVMTNLMTIFPSTSCLKLAGGTGC